MDTKEIKKYIIDNPLMGVKKVQSEIAQKELLGAWNAYCHGSQSVEKTLKDLYSWAKSSGYVKLGDASDYEINAPFASARVKGNTLQVYDLVPFNIKCDSLTISQSITSNGIVSFLKGVPVLVGSIEADRKYIADNTESLRLNFAMRSANTVDRQNKIELTVRKELSDLPIRVVRSAYSVVVSVTLNNMVLDYPIPNKCADDLSDVIQNLKAAVNCFKDAPHGIKLNRRNGNEF